MNIKYYGFRDSISISSSPIKKPVIKEVEDLKDLSLRFSEHIDDLENLLSPFNLQFSFIFPNYIRNVIPQITLTESFSLNINTDNGPSNIREVRCMPFIKKVEIFSTLSQNFSSSLLDHTKDLPKPLDGSELWVTNQKVVDRMLELSHNLPTSIADISQGNPNRAITRGAFKDYMKKLDNWNNDLQSFKGSYARSFSKLLDVSDNLKDSSSDSKGTSAFLNQLKEKYESISRQISSTPSNTAQSSALIEQAGELNKKINSEQANLKEPISIDSKKVLEEAYDVQLEFINLHSEVINTWSNYTSETYLAGEPLSKPFWSKKLPDHVQTSTDEFKSIVNNIDTRKIVLNKD